MVGKFFREPLFHFLLIGAGLFLIFGWRGGPASLPAGQTSPPSAKIVITQDDIDQTITTFTKTWQRPPTEEEAKGLVEDLVRNEIYYREALVIGLDRDDSVIRRRMRQKMEFILEDITAQVEPTDEDLRAFMKKHPDSYLVDPEIAFRHVYVNAAKRGKNAGTDALEILARLNAGADPDAVGDPFLLASDVPLSPLWDVSKQFGEPFGRKLLELKQNSWAGPVPSGFGLHLVFVRKRTGGRLADLKDVREMVKRDWMAERQKELKDAAYGKLRERYVVTVEKAKAGNKAASTVVVGGARQ
jgi:parvulin-like peptidyl-prolyl isomerase